MFTWPLLNHLMSPFVTKVPVQIYPGTKSESWRIRVSIFPPEPISCVRVLVSVKIILPCNFMSNFLRWLKFKSLNLNLSFSHPSGLVTGRMKKSNMLRRSEYWGLVTRLFITYVTVAGLIHSRAWIPEIHWKSILTWNVEITKCHDCLQNNEQNCPMTFKFLRFTLKLSAFMFALLSVYSV